MGQISAQYNILSYQGEGCSPREQSSPESCLTGIRGPSARQWEKISAQWVVGPGDPEALESEFLEAQLSDLINVNSIS